VPDLEAVFREQLKGFFLSSDEVRTHLDAAGGEVTDRQALLTSLETDRASLAAEMDKVMDLYVTGHVSKEGFRARYGPLEERRNRIRDEIPRLQGELDFLKISLASSDQFVREAQDLYGNWEKLNPDEKSRIVEQVVDRITLGNGEIEINLAFRPVTTVTQSPCTSRRSAPRDRA
jgi:hypothetical protein